MSRLVTAMQVALVQADYVADLADDITSDRPLKAAVREYRKDRAAVSLIEGGVGKSEILDACCGGRMWWWDKNHPLAIYMDKRTAPPGSHSTRPNWKCEPDVIGDFRQMPFDDDAFRLVVFDPPHVTREDESRAQDPTGNTLMCYGALHAATEQDDLRRGFSECWRVLAPGGTLVFKWAGALDRVRPHFPATPIVGTKTLRQGSGLGTRWIIFYKPDGK